jgi:hypothetical protein
LAPLSVTADAGRGRGPAAAGPAGPDGATAAGPLGPGPSKTEWNSVSWSVADCACERCNSVEFCCFLV